MKQFTDFMSLKGTEDADYHYRCDGIVASAMEFATNLLYEEQVLSANELGEYHSQVPKLVEAIIKPIRKRVEANRLGLPFPKISAAKQILSEISTNVGNMPNDKDHRRYVTDYYADLDLESDDDFTIIHLKMCQLNTRRELEKLDNPVSADPTPLKEIIGVVNLNTIVFSYAVLSEPFFIVRAHDVFKFSLLGGLVADSLISVLASSDPDNCFFKAVKTLDDLDIYGEMQVDCNTEITNYQKLYHVILNLVHEAYFSPGSGFDQSQPTFTNMSVKQLFYVHAEQYNARNIFLTKSRDFVEVFNCSSSS
ncbi:uncharacterized protein LOC128262600 isoform X2 [Drosophila gunungcola]|uniref:uncharacterized protein LOC128262600 isoform X2 n=1 Tax=Drosophila gunungcola TaxID=103775 RepID=UPI0022E7A143|nr:uncharacterized protein LOC128262600 isoform X2 [Drosophila gunungcola]